MHSYDPAGQHSINRAYLPAVTTEAKGPFVYYVPEGGGGFGGGVQFLKRVNFGGSVLKMYKV